MVVSTLSSGTVSMTEDTCLADRNADLYGLSFREMHVDQQARAMQIAFQDPMGWTEEHGTPLRGTVPKSFAHPIGIRSSLAIVGRDVTWILHDVSKLVVGMDLATLKFSSQYVLEDLPEFLDIPSYYRRSYGQQLPDFDLVEFQQILACNFSPKGRAPWIQAQQFLAGYMLTLDPSAQGLVLLTPQDSLPLLRLNAQCVNLVGPVETIEHIRICSTLLLLASIPGMRLEFSALPFSMAMATHLHVELPTSAHARADVLRAYTAWCLDNVPPNPSA